MINIGIIHTGRLENIENIKTNNPTLFNINERNSRYTLNFITSTWEENYKEKENLFKTDDSLKKISSNLIINTRKEMFDNFIHNQTMVDYINKYITNHTPFEIETTNNQEFFKHFEFIANQNISQFWLLYKAIKNDTTNDFYIKLRPDTQLKHINMEDYIELCIRLFCLQESRFNNTFLDWFGFDNLEQAQNNSLVHMKIMFEQNKIGYIKDQFFAFNRIKSYQIKNDFVETLSMIMNYLEDNSHKITGESMWYELLSKNSYILNDDWNESIDKSEMNID